MIEDPTKIISDQRLKKSNSTECKDEEIKYLIRGIKQKLVYLYLTFYNPKN